MTSAAEEEAQAARDDGEELARSSSLGCEPSFAGCGDAARAAAAPEEVATQARLGREAEAPKIDAIEASGAPRSGSLADEIAKIEAATARRARGGGGEQEGGGAGAACTRAADGAAPQKAET